MLTEAGTPNVDGGMLEARMLEGVTTLDKNTIAKMERKKEDERVVTGSLMSR